MNRKQASLLIIIAFVYALSFTIGTQAQFQVGLSTDKLVYPIWKLGGGVTGKVTNLNPNLTYYLWMQNPNDNAAHFLLRIANAVNGSAAFLLQISPTDPAGTYHLSLSTSAISNPGEFVTNFGVFGTDSSNYQRTQSITIAGGGYAANSTVSLDFKNESAVSIPEFHSTINSDPKGQFSYSFKIGINAIVGNLTVSVNGTSVNGLPASASKLVTLRVAPIGFQLLQSPQQQIERTSNASVRYRLGYPDNSPVTAGNMSTTIEMNGRPVARIPLKLVNATRGEWQSTWISNPSENATRYQFLANPSDFADPFGNKGDGSVLASAFNLTPTTLELTVNTNRTAERAAALQIALTAKYHNHIMANITRANATITTAYGNVVPFAINGSTLVGRYRIQANASLGIWHGNVDLADKYGNGVSTSYTFSVTPARIRFQVKEPAVVQRTTALTINASVNYPDGTPIESGVGLLIRHGNITEIPALRYDSTSAIWRSSYYVTLNATLGPYNISLTARDTFGNSGRFSAISTVVPATLLISPKTNNSTVESFIQINLPVRVTYPNGTRLRTPQGSVLGSYENATGVTVKLSLAFNSTDQNWHMYFLTPEAGNFTFTFIAHDVYGNSGVSDSVYRLQIIPSSRLLSQRLLLAGVIGLLVPIVITVWAIATVSTRRRKHRP